MPASRRPPRQPTADWFPGRPAPAQNKRLGTLPGHARYQYLLASDRRGDELIIGCAKLNAARRAWIEHAQAQGETASKGRPTENSEIATVSGDEPADCRLA